METNDVVRYVEMDSKEKSTAKSKDKKLNDIPELRDSDIQVCYFYFVLFYFALFILF